MVAAVLAALLAWAQPAAPETFPTAPCTAREAVRATVVEIGSRPDHYFGRCVTVTGTFAGVRMYSGREGMYRTQRFGPDGNYSPADLVHRIGIDNQAMRSLPLAYPQQVTVTGRVDSCERRVQRIRDAGGIPFLGGYCHYEGGPTIVVSAYTVIGAGHERLVGEAARRRFGNIVAMPADWPDRRRAEGVTAAFLAALRAGDRARLASLHDFTDPTNTHGQAVLRTLLEDADSPFAALRTAPPLQTVLFVHAAADGTPLGRDRQPNGAVACFCRSPDCGGRWPISLSDANNDPARPFACTWIQASERPSREGLVSTPIGGGWLREPAATAFRIAGNNSTL